MIDPAPGGGPRRRLLSAVLVVGLIAAVVSVVLLAGHGNTGVSTQTDAPAPEESADAATSSPATGGDDAQDTGPVTVATLFFNASTTRDCARMVDLIATSSLAAAGVTADDAMARCRNAVGSRTTAAGADTTDIDVVSADIVSRAQTTAAVAVQFREGARLDTTTIRLVQDVDGWKVDLASLTGMP
jgi:hypothetical protein